MESTFSDLPADLKLIETFGYRPGQGIPRADLHLARIVRSAQTLGFVIDEAALRARMATVSGDQAVRCRMTLEADGRIDLTLAPMPAPLDVIRFAIAEERLDASDLFLYHKTTCRALYDQRRATLPDGVDEWVFLNTRDELCEGTITNIILTMPNGDQLTPPVTSGILPGVYRQSLIDAGTLQEAVLTLADLKAAKQVELVNSLRGSTQAHWIDAPAS